MLSHSGWPGRLLKLGYNIYPVHPRIRNLVCTYILNVLAKYIRNNAFNSKVTGYFDGAKLRG